MKFKYDNKIYETPNLEKKLKRMKLSLEDIEIIQEEIKSNTTNSRWEFEGIKEWRYFKHPNKDIIHCCLIDIGTNQNKFQIFQNLIQSGIVDLEYVNELKEYDKQMVQKIDS